MVYRKYLQIHKFQFFNKIIYSADCTECAAKRNSSEIYKNMYELCLKTKEKTTLSGAGIDKASYEGFSVPSVLSYG